LVSELQLVNPKFQVVQIQDAGHGMSLYKYDLISDCFKIVE